VLFLGLKQTGETPENKYCLISQHEPASHHRSCEKAILVVNDNLQSDTTRLGQMLEDA
jgi:hypothetical protein